MEKYTELLSEIKSQIPVGESFDLLERKLEIAGRDAEMFFVDGLVDGSMMQRVLFSLFSLKTEQLETAETMEQFLQSNLPFLDAMITRDVDQAIKYLY